MSEIGSNTDVQIACRSEAFNHGLWSDDPLRRSWYPIVLVGLAMVGFIAIKTGRDALYFGESGRLEDLPLAFIWIGLMSVPAAMLHLWTMDRLGVRHARTVVLAAIGFAFVIAAPLVDPSRHLFMNILFVGVPVSFAAVFATSWLLAGDLLEGASTETKARVYTRIGASSTLGGVLGGASSRLMSEVLPASGLIGVGGVTIVVCSVLAAAAHRRYPVPETQLDEIQSTVPSGEPECAAPGLATNLDRPLVLTLGTISVAAAVTGLLIELQFYAVATESGSANPTFFASFYLILSAVSLLIQLALAPRIQKAVGIAGALLVLPIALVGASTVMFLSVGATSRFALRVTEGGVKSSIHRAAWEQAFLPLEPERRARIKTKVDGAAARVAEGVAAIGLYFFLRASPLDERSQRLLTIAIGVGLATWIAATWRLKRVTPTLGQRPDGDPAVRLGDACPVTSALGANKRR